MPAIRLGDVPDYFRKQHVAMSGFLEQSEDREVWPARLGYRPALIAVDQQALLVACPGGLSEQQARLPWPILDEIKCVGAVILYRNNDKPLLRIEMDSNDDAEALAEASLHARNQLPDADRNSSSALSQVLLVTSNEVPGHEETAIFGDVFGTVVRARNIFSNMGASLRTAVGGEVGGYTKLVTQSRNDARERLAEAALACGANAVIAMRFDSNEMADVMTEVIAYGTAVTIKPAAFSRSFSSPDGVVTSWATS